MINIDESSISRNTKPSISWSIRGFIPELKSINVAESISLISCISFTGWHFNHIRNKSINSQMFGEFVTDLGKFMNLWASEKGKRSVLLLDNASIHKTKDVKELLSRTFNLVIYLSAYSPSFAPVEHYFSFTKSNIINEHKGIKVSTKSESEMKKLRKAMLIIEQKGIVRMWTHWLCKMKRLVHHFTYHINDL